VTVRRTSAVGAAVWPLMWAIIAMFGTFTAIPIVLCVADPGMPSGFAEVAGLAALASAGMVVGYSLSPSGRGGLLRRPVEPRSFRRVTIGIFLAYALVLSILAATAPSIPLFGAVSGAVAEEVAESRERFLKARSGWATVFVYVHALLAGSIVPYAIAGILAYRLRGRMAAICGFFFGCVLFAEKAFFLKTVIPIAAVEWRRGRRSIVVAVGAVAIASVMTLGIITTRNMSEARSEGGGLVLSEYFSSAHVAEVASSTTEYMAWRAIAVPIFTAVDSLSTFRENHGSQHFLGATSSLISGVFGQERIWFERSVFDYQWGQNATGTGSSNTVFFIEAFVNFGIPGVVIFSIVAGACLAFFARSVDPALAALWPLYLFAIYCGGLIGTLLSNGFVAVAIVSLFVRCPRGSRGTGRRAL
jgi:hypothetical protein